MENGEEHTTPAEDSCGLNNDEECTTFGEAITTNGVEIIVTNFEDKPRSSQEQTTEINKDESMSKHVVVEKTIVERTTSDEEKTTNSEEQAIIGEGKATGIEVKATIGHMKTRSNKERMESSEEKSTIEEGRATSEKRSTVSEEKTIVTEETTVTKIKRVVNHEIDETKDFNLGSLQAGSTGAKDDKPMITDTCAVDGTTSDEREIEENERRIYMDINVNNENDILQGDDGFKKMKNETNDGEKTVQDCEDKVSQEIIKRLKADHEKEMARLQTTLEEDYKQQVLKISEELQVHYQDDLDGKITKLEEDWELEFTKQKMEFDQKIAAVQKDQWNQCQEAIERVTLDAEDHVTSVKHTYEREAAGYRRRIQELMKDQSLSEVKEKERNEEKCQKENEQFQKIKTLEKQLSDERMKIQNQKNGARTELTDLQIEHEKEMEQLRNELQTKYTILLNETRNEMKKKYQDELDEKVGRVESHLRRQYEEDLERTREEIHESSTTLKYKYEKQLSEVFEELEMLHEKNQQHELKESELKKEYEGAMIRIKELKNERKENQQEKNMEETAINEETHQAIKEQTATVSEQRPSTGGQQATTGDKGASIVELKATIDEQQARIKGLQESIAEQQTTISELEQTNRARELEIANIILYSPTSSPRVENQEIDMSTKPEERVQYLEQEVLKYKKKVEELEDEAEDRFERRLCENCETGTKEEIISKAKFLVEKIEQECQEKVESLTEKLEQYDDRLKQEIKLRKELEEKLSKVEEELEKERARSMELSKLSRHLDVNHNVMSHKQSNQEADQEIIGENKQGNQNNRIDDIRNEYEALIHKLNVEITTKDSELSKDADEKVTVDSSVDILKERLQTEKERVKELIGRTREQKNDYESEIGLMQKEIETLIQENKNQEKLADEYKKEIQNKCEIAEECKQQNKLLQVKINDLKMAQVKMSSDHEKELQSIRRAMVEASNKHKEEMTKFQETMEYELEVSSKKVETDFENLRKTFENKENELLQDIQDKTTSMDREMNELLENSFREKEELLEQINHLERLCKDSEIWSTSGEHFLISERSSNDGESACKEPWVASDVGVVRDIVGYNGVDEDVNENRNINENEDSRENNVNEDEEWSFIGGKGSLPWNSRGTQDNDRRVGSFNHNGGIYQGIKVNTKVEKNALEIELENEETERLRHELETMTKCLDAFREECHYLKRSLDNTLDMVQIVKEERDNLLERSDRSAMETTGMLQDLLKYEEIIRKLEIGNEKLEEEKDLLLDCIRETNIKKFAKDQETLMASQDENTLRAGGFRGIGVGRTLFRGNGPGTKQVRGNHLRTTKVRGYEPGATFLRDNGVGATMVPGNYPPEARISGNFENEVEKVHKTEIKVGKVKGDEKEKTSAGDLENKDDVRKSNTSSAVGTELYEKDNMGLPQEKIQRVKILELSTNLEVKNDRCDSVKLEKLDEKSADNGNINHVPEISTQQPHLVIKEWHNSKKTTRDTRKNNMSNPGPRHVIHGSDNIPKTPVNNSKMKTRDYHVNDMSSSGTGHVTHSSQTPVNCSSEKTRDYHVNNMPSSGTGHVTHSSQTPANSSQIQDCGSRDFLTSTAINNSNVKLRLIPNLSGLSPIVSPLERRQHERMLRWQERWNVSANLTHDSLIRNDDDTDLITSADPYRGWHWKAPSTQRLPSSTQRRIPSTEQTPQSIQRITARIERKSPSTRRERSVTFSRREEYIAHVKPKAHNRSRSLDDRFMRSPSDGWNLGSSSEETPLVINFEDFVFRHRVKSSETIANLRDASPAEMWFS